jgi:hypothetical protein
MNKPANKTGVPLITAVILSCLVLISCNPNKQNDVPNSPGIYNKNMAISNNDPVELQALKQPADKPTAASPAGPEEKPNGKGNDDTGSQTPDDTIDSKEIEAAKQKALNYYTGTVFEVVSIEFSGINNGQIVFSVCVKKGGKLQDPNRTIILQKVNGTYKVENEGY